MVALLLALHIYNALNASARMGPQPLCAIKSNPRLSMAPLMAAVVTVTIEPGGSYRRAEVGVFDGELLVRSSVLWEGDRAVGYPRTTRVEWRSLGLPEGDYSVVLVVSGEAGNCRAQDRMTVAGSQP